VLECNIVEPGTRTQIWEPQRGVERIVLHMRNRDFEFGTTIGCSRGKQVSRAAAKRAGQLAYRRESRFTVTVL
jgi:hypothetical protein